MTLTSIQVRGAHDSRMLTEAAIRADPIYLDSILDNDFVVDSRESVCDERRVIGQDASVYSDA